MPSISFTVNDQDIEFLKVQWEGLSAIYASDKTSRDDSFQLLKEKYPEKRRFYHNLSHVRALLNLFESLRNKIQDHNGVRFAIWFHDVVYDTKRSDNEEESASLAAEMLGKLQVDIETIERVQKMILSTKTHSGRNLSDAEKGFLDMDLAILGAGEDIYEEYGNAIREEYSWVSESMYRSSRIKILKRFLERERIYLTDEMKARYEEQAGKNINREIQLLDEKKSRS